MLVKLGVSIEKLKRPMRKALNPIDKVFREFFIEAVVTSTYEGNHSPGSLHYCNDAVDLRKPMIDDHKIVARLKEELGPDFDVINEHNHIHVEFDPKSKKHEFN